ncbi:hypothetical protein HYPSUDRAFT_46946 [Hypholoma sublateritium FD-334 SS-4]|uniref:Uncharacterized protein n=1 Tax=Hypholoma sublateritium (strain FD-334 SS-4) TaxID=945553 RepID=A0A0D2KQC3_HYPSF|nr:hypothetical protein HYPSUDRAFT_46946 [Hypholoma sublateritium FD-334 SS-4]
MTDSAPAPNASPRLLTIVLLPSKHNGTIDEDNRRHVCEEVNISVPSGQKDISYDGNRQCEVSYPVLDVVYLDALPLGLLTGRVCGAPA